MPRCHLLEQVGEMKRALDGYHNIMDLLPREDGERYLQLARDMAKVGSSEFVSTKWKLAHAILSF